jgi:hypothetical protein
MDQQLALSHSADTAVEYGTVGYTHHTPDWSGVAATLALSALTTSTNVEGALAASPVTPQRLR